MTHITRAYRLGELHHFEADSHRFVYLVSAGAIFELDGAAERLVNRLRDGAASHDELMAELVSSGSTETDAQELIQELFQSQVIISGKGGYTALAEPPKDFPLQSLVMNITNQCNLSCTYCYEFGEDKIATPQGKKKYMDLDTAKESVDFLLNESASRRAVHITFFGGETLMNFPLLKTVVSYAKEEAAKRGKYIDFSLTTNATLLTPEIISFLSDNEIGVTVSMDGPAEMQDKRRTFKNGKGSHARVEPRVRALIAGHKTRAIRSEEHTSELQSH